MFGKAYFIATGFMLFVIGTVITFSNSLTSGPCAQMDSMSGGMQVAFNPCTIFAMLPQVGFAMQVIGGLLFVISIALIIRSVSNKKTCSNCKKVLREGTAFCPNCGTKVEKK